jgi:hypothetical protein
MAMLKIVIAASLCAALVGCGGGDGDANSSEGTSPTQPTNSSAAGIYVGTSSNGSKTQAVVFDDFFVLLYGDDKGPTGFIQGKGEAKNGSYTSKQLQDFHAGGFDYAQMSASYMSQKTFNGTIDYIAQGLPTVAFTGTYDPQRSANASLSQFENKKLTLTAQIFTALNNNPNQLPEEFILNLQNGIIRGSGGLQSHKVPNQCQIAGGTYSAKDLMGPALNVNFSFFGGCVYYNQTLSGIMLADGDKVTIVLEAPSKSRGMLMTGTATPLP